MNKNTFFLYANLHTTFTINTYTLNLHFFKYYFIQTLVQIRCFKDCRTLELTIPYTMGLDAWLKKKYLNDKLFVSLKTSIKNGIQQTTYTDVHINKMVQVMVLIFFRLFIFSGSTFPWALFFTSTPFLSCSFS